MPRFNGISHRRKGGVKVNSSNIVEDEYYLYYKASPFSKCSGSTTTTNESSTSLSIFSNGTGKATPPFKQREKEIGGKSHDISGSTAMTELAEVVVDTIAIVRASTSIPDKDKDREIHHKAGSIEMDAENTNENDINANNAPIQGKKNLKCIRRRRKKSSTTTKPIVSSDFTYGDDECGGKEITTPSFTTPKKQSKSATSKENINSPYGGSSRVGISSVVLELEHESPSKSNTNINDNILPKQTLIDSIPFTSEEEENIPEPEETQETEPPLVIEKEATSSTSFVIGLEHAEEGMSLLNTSLEECVVVESTISNHSQNQMDVPIQSNQECVHHVDNDDSGIEHILTQEESLPIEDDNDTNENTAITTLSHAKDAVSTTTISSQVVYEELHADNGETNVVSSSDSNMLEATSMNNLDERKSDDNSAAINIDSPHNTDNIQWPAHKPTTTNFSFPINVDDSKGDNTTLQNSSDTNPAMVIDNSIQWPYESTTNFSFQFNIGSSSGDNGTTGQCSNDSPSPLEEINLSTQDDEKNMHEAISQHDNINEEELSCTNKDYEFIVTSSDNTTNTIVDNPHNNNIQWPNESTATDFSFQFNIEDNNDNDAIVDNNQYNKSSSSPHEKSNALIHQDKTPSIHENPSLPTTNNNHKKDTSLASNKDNESIDSEGTCHYHVQLSPCSSHNDNDNDNDYPNTLLLTQESMEDIEKQKAETMQMLKEKYLTKTTTTCTNTQNVVTDVEQGINQLYSFGVRTQIQPHLLLVPDTDTYKDDPLESTTPTTINPEIHAVPATPVVMRISQLEEHSNSSCPSIDDITTNNSMDLSSSSSPNNENTNSFSSTNEEENPLHDNLTTLPIRIIQNVDTNKEVQSFIQQHVDIIIQNNKSTTPSSTTTTSNNKGFVAIHIPFDKTNSLFSNPNSSLDQSSMIHLSAAISTTSYSSITSSNMTQDKENHENEIFWDSLQKEESGGILYHSIHIFTILQQNAPIQWKKYFPIPVECLLLPSTTTTPLAILRLSPHPVEKQNTSHVLGTLNDILALNEHYGTRHLQEELVALLVLDILNIVALVHHCGCVVMDRLSMQSFLVVHTPTHDDIGKENERQWHLQLIGFGANITTSTKSNTNKNSKTTTTSSDLYAIADIIYRLLTGGKKRLQTQFNKKRKRYEIKGSVNSFRGVLCWDTLFDVLLNVPSSSSLATNLSCLVVQDDDTATSKRTSRWESDVIHAYILTQLLAQVGGGNNYNSIGMSPPTRLFDEFYTHLKFGNSAESILKVSSKLQQKQAYEEDSSETNSLTATISTTHTNSSNKTITQEDIDEINQTWEEKLKALEEKHQTEQKKLQDKMGRLQRERNVAFQRELQMKKKMEKMMSQQTEEFQLRRNIWKEKKRSLQNTIQSLYQQQKQPPQCDTPSPSRRREEDVTSALTSNYTPGSINCKSPKKKKPRWSSSSLRYLTLKGTPPPDLTPSKRQLPAVVAPKKQPRSTSTSICSLQFSTTTTATTTTTSKKNPPTTTANNNNQTKLKRQKKTKIAVYIDSSTSSDEEEYDPMSLHNTKNNGRTMEF